jgi:hypothetical protein
MKTLSQLETEAFLSMAESLKVLEQQLADARSRIDELEAQAHNPYKITSFKVNGVEIGNN